MQPLSRGVLQCPHPVHGLSSLDCLSCLSRGCQAISLSCLFHQPAKFISLTSCLFLRLGRVVGQIDDFITKLDGGEVNPRLGSSSFAGATAGTAGTALVTAASNSAPGFVGGGGRYIAYHVRRGDFQVHVLGTEGGRCHSRGVLLVECGVGRPLLVLLLLLLLPLLLLLLQLLLLFLRLRLRLLLLLLLDNVICNCYHQNRLQIHSCNCTAQANTARGDPGYPCPNPNTNPNLNHNHNPNPNSTSKHSWRRRISLPAQSTLSMTARTKCSIFLRTSITKRK